MLKLKCHFNMTIEYTDTVFIVLLSNEDDTFCLQGVNIFSDLLSINPPFLYLRLIWFKTRNCLTNLKSHLQWNKYKNKTEHVD